MHLVGFIIRKGFLLGAMLLLHLLLDVVTPVTQAFTVRITTHLHISGKLQSVLVTIIIIILLYKTLYFFNNSHNLIN